MDLSEEIKNNQIILVVIPKNEYNNKVMDVVKSIDYVSQKICYAALNKPYSSIKQSIIDSGMDVNKYFFIDVLTSSVQTPPPDENCEFVQSPGALTDISLAFSTGMNEKACEIAFFDAISTLVIYEDVSEIIKFTQTLMTKARVMGKKSVYLALKEDSEELVKDLMMFVDKVVEL